MSSFQRVIKYLAIALAVFIIINILSAIYFGISAFAGIFYNNSGSYITDKLNTLSVQDEDISIFDIDVDATKLIIQKGSGFQVETNNQNIKSTQRNGRLLLEEKTHNLFRTSKNSELVVTIPEEMIFDEVSIETGAGVVQIETLTTKKLELDLGAGKVSIDNLVVTEKTEINGGAGEINILTGKIQQLDLDIGVGKFTLTSELTGRSKIDAGVGEVVLNLLGTLEDYQIEVEKGIGSIEIDGQSVADGSIVGSGTTPLKIDGGVGKIEVNFLNGRNVVQ